jgi:hypothetical protein
VDAAHIVRKGVVVKFPRGAPNHCSGFLRDLKVFANSLELKNQIVMKMIGLAALTGNAVNIHSDKLRPRSRGKLCPSLFNDFAASGIANFAIFLIDMAAWEKPTIEAAMMDQEYPLSIW